jgi:hypothetical protein
MKPVTVRGRLTHLPVGLKVTAVLLVLAVFGGAVADGIHGAGGAVAGVLLVAASYVASSFVIAWADSIHPRMVLPVGLLTYVVKFAALGVGMYALASTGWDGLPALGVAVIVATLAWATAHAWWLWHAKIPYVDV